MAPVLHVTGIALPDGEQREFWVADGRISTTEIPDAQSLPRGWILPGFVDAHCHIGLDASGGVGPDTQEEQATAERDAGVLLARDCGVPVNTHWMDDRPDLPRIVRAGQHIARPKRYIRNYGLEIEPEQLVETVAEQAIRGDGWVKLVGDWIDREVGDLAPCWPADVLKAAIDRAHELGARVTTHVFGEAALPDLIAAGIDCLEHGTALAADQLADMASRGVGLVPTLINIANFPQIAEQAEGKFPAYAAHMRALHARVEEMVRTAWEAGVPVYAGTDAGGALPHGLIAQEVAALHRAGLPPLDAIAAGSWRAREWLGYDADLRDGASADFVVLPGDPVADLGVLAHPAAIVLRGVAYRA